MLSEDRPKPLKQAENLFYQEIDSQRYLINEIKKNIYNIDLYMDKCYLKELIDGFYDY